MRTFDDPVHRHGGKWFFWDETFEKRIGPFTSEAEADHGYTGYCRKVLELSNA